MNLEKIEGKYWLKDREGEKVAFNFPVDAREAMSRVGEDGQPLFFMIEEEVTEVKEEEVPTEE